MAQKFLIALLVLASLVVACSLRGTNATSAQTIPTDTPNPTGTPESQPPKPQVGYTPVAEGVVSPVVIQRVPRRGETLSPDGAIELIFDRAMDQAAVEQALTVQQAAEKPTAVAVKFDWPDDRTVRVKPAQALPREALFDVILTQKATAGSGEPLAEPYTFRFSTTGYLEVSQVIPAPDTTDLEADSTITVMFNRPVVPMTTLAEMASLPQPLTFEPAVTGSGEWLNTSVYVFTPAQPLSGGTTYTAKVVAGLKDTAGALLAQDYVWKFTTIPPFVVWNTPSDGSTLVDINTAVQVQFNQPVDLVSAQKAFTMAGKGGLLKSATVAGKFALVDNTLVFTPTKSLDFDATYTVNLEAGITAKAGGAGMVEPYTFRFTTVPLPKIVSTFPADGERNAPSRTDFRITFNTPINPDTVMPNVEFTPPLSPTQVYTWYSSYDNTFTINFGAQPSSDYKVIIKNGIADPYGNTIPQGRTVKFHTASLAPNYQLRVPDMIATYDAARPAQVVIGHINLHRVDLTLYRLPVDMLERPYWQFYDYRPDAKAEIRNWKQNLEAPQNKQAYTVIDLAEKAGGTLEPGVYMLKTNSPDLDKNNRYDRNHILVVSNLNLTIKTGPTETMVWATDLASGKPAANLPVKFIEYDAAALKTVTTDAEGIARLTLNRNHNEILAYSAEPFAAVAQNWSRGISPWDFGMGEGVYGQPMRAYIYTDRPLYRPDQTVNFKGVIRGEKDGAYRVADAGQVHVVVRDATYTEIFNDTLPTSPLGAFSGSVKLEKGASLGQYAIAVDVADLYYETWFQVAAYRAPEFEVTVTPGQAQIQRGDDLTATIQTSYFFGGPLAQANVDWNVTAERYTFKPPWGGRYSFSDADDPYACFDCWWWPQAAAPEPILSGNGQTDAAGQLPVTLTAQTISATLTTRAARLTVEANATGPDNQLISGRTSVVVHPGPYYIGLSPQKYVGDAGRESLIDLVAVDWAGERLPAKALKIEFYRREWINTFISNETGGGYWDWTTKDTLVDTATATTNDRGEAIAAFTPATGGSFRVVASPAEPTRAEQAIRSAIFIWVSGPDQVSWRRENNDRITLISDKSSYAVGDVAEILIPSPLAAPVTALVTVERGGILQYDVVTLETNSQIYRLPITEADIPNIYVSAVLVKGRTAEELAEFKMGLLPFDVSAAPKTLSLKIEPDTEQAEPGQEVAYTVTAANPDGSPAAGAELSVDMVDKAVLSLQPRTTDIVSAFYARRALEVQTAGTLSVSANRYLKEVAEDLAIEIDQTTMGREAGKGGEAESFALDGAVMKEEMAVEAPMMAAMPTMAPAPAAMADNIAPPAGVEIRTEFADTAFWEPALVTDKTGKAGFTVTLPDNLTTWVVRGVGVGADTVVGEQSADLVATKPLLVRPVTPRFFVVDDKAQLAANVSNNTKTDLAVEVSLSAEGIGISADTPPRQTVTIPARSEAKVTWNVTVNDVTETQLIFAAVSGDYNDASKPRLSTGPDGSLMVLRYTAPDIVGTAGQLTEGGSRTETIALPPDFDNRRGALTVQVDPSLAAGMRDSLTYLEHFEYECTEQTVSRFLPNVLTYNALKSLGVENAELAAKLPGLLETGLEKLYREQNPDGGWGWWYKTDEWYSSPHISAYVVFALIKAQQAGVEISNTALANGLNYLKGQITQVQDYKNYRYANRQAWLLYVLAEGQSAPQNVLDELYDNRSKLSTYARAYLAQALWLGNPQDGRLKTLLSDISNAAILSATGAHWEESEYDWWAMNTDTRSTAIVLDTLAKLDPDNALNPNVVRWLMVARKAGIWETTQETAWALISLTDWMVQTGELEANFSFNVALNDKGLAEGNATPATVGDSTVVTVPIADLLADAANALTIARTDGNGRLYYTAHLEVYLPVESIEPADRGIMVSRRYTLASCDKGPECAEVREAKLGDVIRVDLTIIAPNDLYYVVLEDPLPAGGEAIDTGLATTSLLAMDPSLTRQNSRYWWWWRWYSRSELRDEKVVLFADYLRKGTYEYSYTFRATLPGDYHVIPAVAREFYFPEVFGRSDGRLLSIGE